MLELKFKKIPYDTIKFMKENVGSNKDCYESAVGVLEELLPSGEIHILNSANSCLITLAQSIPEPVLVADMGGWNGFLKSCDLFGKNVKKIESDNGLINIEKLDKYLNSNDIKTFYITSLAGYTARQPIKEIYELCDTYQVMLVVDISGSIGDEELTKHADIQVASTGSPKIINIENGGFINDMTKKIELNGHLLKSLKADTITCAGIVNEAPKAITIQKKTVEANRYLKQKLHKQLEGDSIHNIIHPDIDGLNTIITTQSKSKAKKLAQNIRINIKCDGNIITIGPNYNRIKKASVNIETKNIDPSSLTKENMDTLADIIIKEIKKD